MEFVHIGPIYFLFLVLYFWNINKVFDFLTKKHGDVDFRINFYFRKVYLLNTPAGVKYVLSSKSVELTFIQNNLNKYLGHSRTINCMDSSSEEWRNLHTVLKQTLNNPNSGIREALERNKYLLFKTYPSLNDAVESYIGRVLAEFNYGPNVNFKLYMKTRKMILAYLKRFHQSNAVRTPFVGNIWARFMNWYHRSELKAINHNLNLLSRAIKHKCAIQDFATQLSSTYDANLVADFVQENTLLLVLENDFIHSVMMDQLVQPIDTDFETSVANGFLYPIRYRIIKNNSDGVLENNSIAIYHLLNSKLYFSWGPRACVGQVMVKNAIMPVIQEIKHWVKVDRNKNWYHTNRSANLPLLDNVTDYQIILPENYIEENIKAFTNDANVKMYDLITMYNHPFLFKYIVVQLINKISPLNVQAIAAPEARALPLAGAVAFKLGLPLYVIRKEGKLPGSVHQVKFSKGYTAKPDILEINKNDFTSQNIVLIDDGIASGGSAKACIDLVSMCNGIVSHVFVIVKHTYCQCIDLGVPVNHLFSINKY